MPDEDDNVKIDEDQVPETTLHAHAEEEDTGTEAEDERDDEPAGEVHEGEQDASQAAKTGGATSGGPPSEDAGEDPSNA
jgi:hypothetical protein